VLLEAGASSLPMVATRAGGNAEVFAPEQKPWLVPPKEPRALAEAMLRILTMTEGERRAAGAAARNFVLTHHSMDLMLDRWEELYARLLSEKRALRVAAEAER
jgi:glycosyltransferase involved in cell wall biosynthesis